MGFPNTIFGVAGDEKAVTTVQGRPDLGTRLALEDGRVFYYARSTGTIGAGELVESNATTAADALDATINSAAAVGSFSVSLGSLSSDAAVADFWKDGWLGINGGAGQGHVYKIETHIAKTTELTLDITLKAGDPIQEALATASSIGGLWQNEYQLVNQAVAAGITARTTSALGVAATEVADGEFFWVQTWGRAQCLVEGVVAIDEAVSVSTVAGALGPALASDAVSTGVATGSTGQTVFTRILGYAVSPVATATDSTAIELTIKA